MAKNANPKLIGGFAVGAIALLVIGAFAFGGGNFLKPQAKAVLFFVNSSLSGLTVGSPVTFRGIKVETTTVLYAEPLAPQPGWERLADPLRRHATRILKTKIPVKGVPLYTDARHYAARKIPIVLYGAGPRTILEANAHNANENLRLNDLKAATKIVALAVRDVLMKG